MKTPEPEARIATGCQSPLSAGRVRGYIIVALLAITVSVFCVSRQADFLTWDDDYNIVNNPHLQAGLSWDSLRWMFTDAKYVPRYMPLGWLGLAVNCPTGHLNPTVFHVGNIALHSLNTVLFFLVLVRIFNLACARLNSAASPSQILCCAAFGALFWAVHPLRVEAVAWASARLYQQTLLFLLLSALAYLKAHETSHPSNRRHRWQSASVAMLLASLLTYPLALGYVVILVAFDIFLLQRFPLRQKRWWNPTARLVWIEKLPFCFAILLTLILALAARAHSPDWQTPPSLAEFTLTERVMQSFYVWANYLWKTCVPVGLTPMYPELLSFNPWSGPFLMSAALVLSISMVLIWRWRTYSGVLGLWICYLLWLVPTLGLTEHAHVAADRYSFLPALLLSVLLGGALLKWLPRFSHPAIPACACTALLTVFSVASSRQCHVWLDDDHLLPHVIAGLKNHPVRAKVAALYGDTLMRNQAWSKAEESFRNSLRVNDQDATVHARLGDVLANQGRLTNAIASYEKAIAIDADATQARQGLAVALGSVRRFDEAAHQFREVLRRDTNNPVAWHNLAITVHQLGDTNLSRTYYARAKELQRENESRGKL